MLNSEIPTIELPMNNPKVFRVVGINDPHFSERAPSNFKTTEDYFSHVKENVTKVIEKARSLNADAVLWGGDMFHSINAKAIPHSLVSQISSLLTMVDTGGEDENLRFKALPSLGIAGNHDYKNGSVEAGLSGQPLETLINSGIFHLLDRTEYVFTSSEDKNFSVRIAGGSYYHSRADHVKEKKRKGATHLIALGHFWLEKSDGGFFGEKVYGHGYFSDSEVDTLMVGHHHEDKGITTIGRQAFASQGSISITGHHNECLDRKPAAILIELKPEYSEEGTFSIDRKVYILRPSQKSGRDLVDENKVSQKKKENKQISDFLSHDTGETSIESPMDYLGDMKLTKEIKERTATYIKRAEESVKETEMIGEDNEGSAE
jgi:DNA repair exonuclease SbcCD nuclease subunit